jgi:hypothetical protein
MDPDPAIFGIDPQDANKKQIFFKKFVCLMEDTFTSFFNDKKSKKKSQNSRYQGFSSYFFLLIEGSGAGSGSIPLTYGSGSGSRRPKNIRLRRIRIRNTGIMENISDLRKVSLTAASAASSSSFR